MHSGKSILFSTRSPERLFLLMVLGWWLVNLLQAGLTEISMDEAYYWMYAQRLTWGYFDHPPMIALWVWLGTKVFAYESGVRLLTTLAQPAALGLLWLTTAPASRTSSNVLLFFGIAAVLPILGVYGFVATPDSPFLFFTALFLFAYQRFVERPATAIIALLAVAMAGILYSKYHGVLVIGFIVLSNLRLLLNVRFWLAGILALLLLTPHILWQVINEFPSIQYHLSDRSRPLQWKHVINYWPNQLAAFNPLLIVPGLVWIMRNRATDALERGGKFILFGFLLFFFATSYRGHVEPHWTVVAQMPFLLLMYRLVTADEKIRRYITRFAFPTLAIIVFVRVALIIDFLPVDLKFHGRRAWAQDLAAQAQGRPVVFTDSYQNASQYAFFTRQPSTSLNSIYFRRNQFDLWQFDTSFAGGPVMLLSHPSDSMARAHVTPDGKKRHIRMLDTFAPVNRVIARYELADSVAWMPGDTVRFKMRVSNPYSHVIPLRDPEWPVMFFGEFFPLKPKAVPLHLEPEWPELPAGRPQRPGVLVFTATMVVPDLPPGEYPFAIGISAGPVQEAYNSVRRKVTIGPLEISKK